MYMIRNSTVNALLAIFHNNYSSAHQESGNNSDTKPEKEGADDHVLLSHNLETSCRLLLGMHKSV